jgi:hypothetical protein
MTDFRKERSEYEYLVKQFVPAYPQLVQDAQLFLGTSYKAEDYPDASVIADKFKMDMQVMPVPNDDFRVDIADEELSRIQDEVEARVKQAGQQAMQEVWQRLYDKVSHMADRLSKLDDPKSRFHESTLDHVTDLCELLPRLNVLDDPNLEAMRQEVEGKLAGLSKDSVVLSPTFRQTKIDEANDIAARMAAFMGGLN